MSEEEKKVLEGLKEEINKPLEVPEDKFNTFILYNIESAKIILNLIEKQSKEIEELKEENKKYIIKMTDEQYSRVIELVEFDINKKWQDKIKSKIEECENKIKKIRSKKVINEPQDTIVITRYAHYISVLQSLLEKE